MSYQALATKYRPKTFRDLVGQEGVAKALVNAIRLGREPHGIIFSGVRGIGKTTTARLYAKALNCDNGSTPEPCGECDSCIAIEEGRHEDVLEIDGASNTGVDDVRALRETVDYVPQRSKFKVYIIDEVHMLSQSAFNALLKTLEEPPDHVVFIFATTELQKVPETILSRCQTFYLQRFSLLDIVNRLKSILELESIAYEEKALTLVAKEGRGSMRDSLTFLDQAIALGDGQVKLDALAGVVSQVSATEYLGLLKALIAKSSSEVLQLVTEIDQAGREFAEVVEEVAILVRHAFIVKDIGVDAIDIALLGLDSNELNMIKDLAQDAKPLDLNRLFRTLNACRKDLDGSDLDRYVFENYLLEWCLDPGLPSLDEINLSSSSGSRARNQSAASLGSAPREKKPSFSSRNIRDELRNSSKSLPPPVAVEPKNSQVPGESRVAAEAQEKVFPNSWRELVEQWKSYKPLQARVLEDTYLVSYDTSLIHIAVAGSSMAAGKLMQPAIQSKIQAAFKELFGFNGKFQVSKQEGLKNSGSEHDASKREEINTDTLLNIKKREKIAEKAKLAESVKQDPFTQEVVKAFDGKIESINVD